MSERNLLKSIKLTDEHVIRSKIKKMKVKCAAEVFNARLSVCIEYKSKIKDNLISDYYFLLIYWIILFLYYLLHYIIYIYFI